MTEFTHQVFAPQFPRQVSAARVRRSVALARYLSEPCSNSTFTLAQLLSVFCAALSERLLLIFLKEDTTTAIRVLKSIIEDHERDSGRVPKDLQVNLISNLIVQFTRAQGLPMASRFAYGEGMVRKCEFADDFKLTLKKALFDRQAIQCNHLMIHPYQDNAVGNPGTW